MGTAQSVLDKADASGLLDGNPVGLKSSLKVFLDAHMHMLSITSWLAVFGPQRLHSSFLLSDYCWQCWPLCSWTVGLQTQAQHSRSYQIS